MASGSAGIPWAEDFVKNFVDGSRSDGTMPLTRGACPRGSGKLSIISGSAPATARERFVATLNFGRPDRIFYAFGRPRKATIQAWYLQGLPRMPDAGDYGCPQEFLDLIGADPVQSLPTETDTWPLFEERTLRETEHSRIWVDAHGIVMEDAGAHLKTPGFRTRRYVEHPVKCAADWRRLRDERFDPYAAGRYRADWDELARQSKGRDVPIQLVVHGLYWKARDWVGFENLSIMFHDNPSLVHEMMEYRAWFIMEVLKRALTDVEVDCVMLSEDMCYKHAMMISPQMFRGFMMPHYKKIAEFLRSCRVPILMVDSDGHSGQLIPLLIEAGFNGLWPLEIAANNDPVEYRRKYGRQIAFAGAIDKRAITTKENVYREVMSKVPWLLEQRGYLPGVDHAVPPTAHLRGFLYFCELIKALAEKRRVPLPDETLEIERHLGPVESYWSADLGIQDD